MKKLRLKRKYKNILIYCFSVICLVSLVFGVIALYNYRIKNINSKQPESIQIKK